MPGPFVVFDLLIRRTDDRTGIVHPPGMSFFELERVALGPGSPALRGWSRVTREIVTSPLYRAAADIVTRAGIEQELVLAPEREEKRSQVPADRSLMSVTRAANTLGISRAAVHKAIQQKRLPSHRYGNVLLVEREAVRRYAQARSERVGTPPSKRRRHAPGGSDEGTLVAKGR